MSCQIVRLSRVKLSVKVVSLLKVVSDRPSRSCQNLVLMHNIARRADKDGAHYGTQGGND